MMDLLQTTSCQASQILCKKLNKYLVEKQFCFRWTFDDIQNKTEAKKASQSFDVISKNDRKKNSRFFKVVK